MSDELREAIQETAMVLQQTVEGCDEFHAGGLVLDAARRWASLTDDDKVEIAMKALMPYMAEDMPGWSEGWQKRAIRAALAAVRDRSTG